MKRIFLSLAILVGLIFPAMAGSMTLLGAGAAGVACTPVTYPASPLYQSLALTDSWTVSNATAATNNQVSPACTTTAYKLTEDATASVSHQTTKNPAAFTSVASTTYTLTWYAKRVTGTRNIQVNLFSTAFNSQVFWGADLGTCTTNVAAAIGIAGFTSPTGTASVGPGGYCKLVLTWVGKTDTGVAIQFQMMSGTSTTYSGDGTSAIAIWGVDIR